MVVEGTGGGAGMGCETGPLICALSDPGSVAAGVGTTGEGSSEDSVRGCPVEDSLSSCITVSPGGRADARSALGPVGGAIARPDGTFALSADGASGAVLTAAGVETVGAGTIGTADFGGGIGTVLGLTSSAGALQTLDPKAGTAAGGDEARGAYLSLDASARLANKASSFPRSLRESFAADGSMASDERREYMSVCGPRRSDGDA